MSNSQRWTPFPVGEMPAEIEVWEEGPPYGRVELLLETPEFGDHDVASVRDAHTGEHFLLRRGVDCGLGCRCAAEVTWLK